MKATRLPQALIALLLFTTATLCVHAEDEQIKVESRVYQFDTEIEKTPRSNTQGTVSIQNAGSETTVVSKNRDALDSFVSDVNFWIYDSWVTLIADPDYDGYYSAFSVEFDADTVFSRVPMYAIIYLGTNGNFDSIHETSTFVIRGEDSDDSLIIESDLLSGFPPLDYEVLIELYDAETNELVAVTDGYSDADLAYVSLESQNYEEVYEETVVVVEEHGGAATLPLLLLLGGVVYWRRKRR